MKILLALLLILSKESYSLHGLSTKSALTLPYKEPCIEEFLVSIENKAGETSVSIFSANGHGNQGEVADELPQTSAIPLTNPNLISRGCGENFFRCQNILMETNTSTTSGTTTSTQYIAFIPLDNQIYLVELMKSGNMNMQFGAGYSLPTESCTPSAMFKIENGFYAICTNSSENSISLFEIRLNKTSLRNSYLVHMPDVHHNFNGFNVTNASNYVHMFWNRNHYILFAIDNAMFAILPIEGTIINDGFSAIGASCRNVKKLAPTGNDGELLAYCSYHVVYYSIDYLDWTLQDTYENAGTPYICPDASLSLSVFTNNHYITYFIDEHKEDIQINSFHSGVCYGSANQSFFAYIDQRGLFILNTTAAEMIQVPNISCLEDECQPLQIVENRYLIVKRSDEEGGTVFVIDTMRDAVIIKAMHILPALATLIVDMEHKCNNNVQNSTEKPKLGKIVGPTAAGVLIVIILVLTVSSIIAFIRWHYRKNSKDQNLGLSAPCQESNRSGRCEAVPSNSTIIVEPASLSGNAQDEHSATVRPVNETTEGQAMTSQQVGYHSQHGIGEVERKKEENLHNKPEFKVAIESDSVECPAEVSSTTNQEGETECDPDHEDEAPLIPQAAV